MENNCYKRVQEGRKEGRKISLYNNRLREAHVVRGTLDDAHCV